MTKRECVLIFLVLAAIAVLCINPIGDFDTGYHLQNGAFIATHGFIPTHDIFSYTAPGALWINHYWLSDVFFYFVYHATGAWGLITAIGLIAALTYAFVLATAFLKSKNKILAVAFVIPYGILTYELWVVRPQVMTYLLTAIVIFIFEKWRAGGNEKILLALPILFFLWGNLHAGVPMGIGIIGLYLLNEIFTGKNRRTKWHLLILSVISVGATLLNPNGYKVLTYDSIISGTVSQLGVEEWKSLLVYLGEWQALAFLLLIVLIFCLALYALVRHRSHGIDWPSVGLLVTATILPLISIRHVGFFPILTFPIFLWSLEKIFPDIAKASGRIASLCVFTLLVVLIAHGAQSIAGMPTINTDTLPVGATQFIRAENIQGPMLNDAAFGGYLIWQLWPQQSVFIDGRDEVYAGGIANDYVDIMEANADLAYLVNDKYHINYLILWYQAPLSNLIANLSDQLETKLGFKLVYWDDTAIILARDDPQNKNLISQFGYTYISPFVPANAIPLADRPAAVKELLRAMNISPDSTILQNYL